MEEYKVLITTSGLGSRLGNLTDYTNKSLIRIGDKPAISYIIESYPADTQFVISLGHFGKHVKEFLTLAYPNKNFLFVEIDNYKGDGSSLGYSILKCKEFLQTPFIFHASDTIIKDYNVVHPTFNYVVGSYKEDSSQYRTLNLNNGKLVKINEKGELGYDFSYIGVCGIKDYKIFFDELEKLIFNNHKDTSDVHVINNMLKDIEFFYKELNYGNWYDVGNVSELTKTRKAFKSNVDILDKKDESIFFFDDFVVKFFYDKKILINRVLRAKSLGELVPQIISYGENFYTYKKANGNVLSKTITLTKFKSFLEWSVKNLWIKKDGTFFIKKCEEFYITKTKKRIQEFLQSDLDESEIINGTEIESVFNLISKIDKNWLCDGKPSQFHGDFILDNVIDTQKEFCLIDWRQDFAGELEVGDVYYDLAKLNHNLVLNHEIISKNLFGFEKNNCYILTNSKLNECKEELHKFIVKNGYDLKKVKLLTALIWLNMAPLHEYPFNNFLFTFGKYNLSKVLNDE